MHAFEFKYSPELRSKLLLTFSKAYPQHSKIPGLALADCNNRQGKPKERFQYSPLSFHKHTSGCFMFGQTGAASPGGRKVKSCNKPFID
ncbi:MAG: hypothetical protein WC341_12075, partial [Bacteroidales bacterium]|jgi:hypothetical protein